MLSIQDVDLTPNPHALKFVLSDKLLNHEKRQFANKEAAANDPFASGIFNIPGVVSVFYMDKFVTIEKQKDANWGMIQRPFIDYLKSVDLAIIPEEKVVEYSEEESNEMISKINQLLNQKVRPALANDGGGLELIGLEGNVVTIRYQGACGSCPSAINGTLMAIEGLLRRDIDPTLTVVPG